MTVDGQHRLSSAAGLSSRRSRLYAVTSSDGRSAGGYSV